MTISDRRDSSLFILSDVITQFGAGMVMSASAWYIFDESRSNSLVALVAAANTGSGVMMSLLAGALVDRFNPKLVAQVSHLLRISLILLSLLLFQEFDFHPIFAFILALNNGLGWNLYFPASKSIINNVTRKQARVGVNSAAEVSMQVGLFSSGALAGVLYNVIGFVSILAIATSAFVVGFGILALVRISAGSELSSDAPSSLAESFRGGFVFAKQQPALFGAASVLFFPFIAANVFATILPGFVTEALSSDAPVYGFIDMTWGVAAAAVGVIVAAVSKRKSVSVTAVVSTGLVTLVVYGVIMFFTSNWIVALALTATAGFAAAAVRILLYARLMDVIPEGVFGRVISMTNMVGLILQMILSQLAGLSMDALGPGFGFLIIALISVTGLLLFAKTMRALQCPSKT